MRKFFAHGVTRHAIEADPSAKIKANSIIGPRPVNRTRIMITEQELRKMLPALPAIGPQYELMVRILLATATRIGELVYAEWEHINFQKREWTIPASNIKGRSVKVQNGEIVKDFVITLTNPLLG